MKPGGELESFGVLCSVDEREKEKMPTRRDLSTIEKLKQVGERLIQGSHRQNDRYISKL